MRIGGPSGASTSNTRAVAATRRFEDSNSVTRMSYVRVGEAKRMFQEAVELDPAERDAFVREPCAASARSARVRPHGCHFPFVQLSLASYHPLLISSILPGLAAFQL